MGFLPFNASDFESIPADTNDGLPVGTANNLIIRIRPETGSAPSYPMIDGGDGCEDWYLVHPNISRVVGATKRNLYLAETKGRQFLLPIRTEKFDWKPDETAESAFLAVNLAMKAPMKLTYERVGSSGLYRATKASATSGEPTWRTESLRDLVNEAFVGRCIEDSNHPAIEIAKAKKLKTRP